MADAKLLEAQKAANPVEKKGQNKDQGYSYATAADVVTEARRALHEAGLVGLVTFSEPEEREVESKAGSRGVYARLAAELRIIDPETAEIVATAWTFGAGIDYPGDKAVYKAMTGAAKYAYAMALGIPFGDDPEDTTTSAPEAREAAAPEKGFASEKQEKYLRTLVRDQNGDENLIAGYLAANFDGTRNGGISRAIDRLKNEGPPAMRDLTALAESWAAELSDVPGDEADLSGADFDPHYEEHEGKQETLTEGEAK